MTPEQLAIKNVGKVVCICMHLIQIKLYNSKTLILFYFSD